LTVLIVLTAAMAIAPPTALGASTLAARCDGVKLRTRPTTTARTLRSLSAGAKVTAVAKVTGGHWSVRCAGSSSSGSAWWRITSINGKSVKALYGVSYVYGATALFKTVITPVTLEAACGGVSLRTGPKTTATSKRTLTVGTDVTVYGTVTGGSWKATCNGSSVSGTSWYRITRIAGVSVKTRYGVTYLYGAKGLFRAPTASTPKPTPSPTPTPTPKPTPTPAPTATPAPTPTPTPAAWGNYTQGIDISHWQGTIDWAKVAASGKRFAFMKASEDTDFVDDRYLTNRAQAKANGLVVGAYHFARPELTITDTAGTPDPVPDAVAEADHFIDTATPRSGELIPVLDLEDYGKTATTPGLSPTDLQTWVRAFLERVYDRTGVRAAIYVSPSFWSTYMGNTRWFADNGYATLWIAHWTSAAGPTLPASNWGGLGWTFWQYTSSGTVPGISGRVDLDFYRSADFGPVLIP
jgi:GH25 family lysozyme M1 (1,4-beta-N-acetylmuramidase)